MCNHQQPAERGSEMTPKQRIIAAFKGQQPDDIVPTFEFVFGLTKELTGKDFTNLDGLTGRKLEYGIKYNAELYLEVAERLDYSAITLGDLRVIKELVRMEADRNYLLTYKNGDKTWRFYGENNLEEACLKLFTEPDEFKRSLDRATDSAIESAKPLIDSGVECIVMGADYATTKGPFLSPKMFAEFIVPYLHRTISGHQNNGAYVIKHTDGDIMPILDQIVACSPDAIHSIDPTAGMDIAVFKKLVGDKVCLAGNVDCAALMKGSKEEIKNSALYCLKHGKPGGGYIFMTSNSVTPPMKVEDYIMMLELRKKYGRYDREVEIPL
jgi:uroporphyrinogen decarboxylase